VNRLRPIHFALAGAVVFLLGLGLGRATGRPDTVIAGDSTERSTSTTSPTSSSTTGEPSITSTTAGSTESTTSASVAPTTSAVSGPAAPGPCPPAPSTLAAKAAYVVLPGYASGEMSKAEALLEGANPPAGIFVNNDLTDAAGRTLARIQRERRTIVAIDEEGGRVQRLDQLLPDLPSAEQQAPRGAEAVKALAASRGAALRSYGITMDFAPVVDLRSPSSESVIADRSYGADPAAVARVAGAFADGLESAGVVPTFKHFPGHGHGAGDSHRESQVVTPPFGQMLQSDLVPYAQLVGAHRDAAVMVGHLTVPDLTDGLPASVSPNAYRALRNLGFRGVAVTDDLSGMDAIASHYSPAKAGVAALGAGADLVTYQTWSSYGSVVAAIEAAVRSGTVTQARLDEAVGRLRAQLGC
jgi:beta-N-acetylhexosaminidase